jgi:hypothetical protein
MPNATQDYYAFISYSHEDASWAERLHQDLIAKGIPKEMLFLDKPTMASGDLWREQLRAALNKSCYLVVLWSKNAAKSEWVDAELAHFENKINRPGSQLIQVRQRMIFVSLDTDNEAYSDIQMRTELKDAFLKEAALKKEAAKAAGLKVAEEEVDPPYPKIDEFLKAKPNELLWKEVVNTIYETITREEVTIPVSQLILATTSDRLMNNIDFSAVPDFADFTESLDTLTKTIEIGDKAELIARYGKTRMEWKPICGNSTNVKALLDDLRDQVNVISSDANFRWAPVSDAFWDDPDVAIATAKKLAKGLSVIVIDPISLYDPKVYRRFNDLKDNGCFDNENAVVLVLSHFKMSAPILSFRDLIKKVARQVFNDYYQPGVRKIPYARCSFNFGDELGLSRPVLATIKQFLHHSQPQQNAIPTSVGERK